MGGQYVCVHMRDRMATQLHTGYRSLHHHKQSFQLLSYSQYFQMTTESLPGFFAVQVPREVSGAEHQPAGTVSRS